MFKEKNPEPNMLADVNAEITVDGKILAMWEIRGEFAEQIKSDSDVIEFEWMTDALRSLPSGDAFTLAHWVIEDEIHRPIRYQSESGQQLLKAARELSRSKI